METQEPSFTARLKSEVHSHLVIVANPYTAWFERGEASLEQARAFLIQFSVFSNQFLVAQLKKMLNADTVEAMRESKEILANEIGVGFRAPTGAEDPELGATSGSIDGGTFRFRAAHFELLVRMAGGLGLRVADLGRRSFGTAETLFFCDELVRLYGHEDYATATAASWAVENWAAAGFWDQLVKGWEIFRDRQRLPQLNIGFFSWHARLEANHAQHTWDELTEWRAEHDVDEDAFVARAIEMLDAVEVFWSGLDRQRREIGVSRPAGARGVVSARAS
jgi:pyrroloquinoline quinone (PQQ) biosynthesis protein C